MSQHTTLMLMLACAGLLPACGHLPGPASQGNHVAPPQARIDDSPATRTAAFCKLGKRMLELGDPRAALAAYREALLLEPDSADARNGAAVLHAQLGQLETARSMLQALALQAPTARTYNNLGYVLYLQESMPRRPMRCASRCSSTTASSRRAPTWTWPSRRWRAASAQSMPPRRPSRPTWRRRPCQQRRPAACS